MLAAGEIKWAVGFLEGEGSFCWNKSTPMAEASQSHLEPLERLRAAFGGRIVGPYQPKNPRAVPMFKWRIYGAEAVGVFMTVFCELSQVRKSQIRTVLETWKSRKRKRGNSNG